MAIIWSLSFLGYHIGILLYAIVAMMFTIQSHYNAVLVCLAYLVSWCCLRRRKEFLQAGSLMPPGQGKECWAHGKDTGEGCLWQDPPCVCVWMGEGSLRPARVGEHLSWSSFVSGASGFALLSILPYPVLSYSEGRSLPGLPSVPMSCGLGNARTGSPSSIGWGSPQRPVTLGASGPRFLANLLLPPLRHLLRLLLVLFPGFMVVVRGRSRQKWVYTTMSRPDFRPVHRYWDPVWIVCGKCGRMIYRICVD